jgi:8-oxo-dGTP diphosphatase/2-hydroxy-dATP diphosphatase
VSQVSQPSSQSVTKSSGLPWGEEADYHTDVRLNSNHETAEEAVTVGSCWARGLQPATGSLARAGGRPALEAVRGEMPGSPAFKELTNAFIVKEGRVLLGLKKRGFGQGKWNGFGGKIEAGESALGAAQREMREEAGVTMADPVRLGTVLYRYDGMDKVLRVAVFRAAAIAGGEQPRESEEMRPQWFPLDKVPFEQMWADDKHWYDLLIAGEPFDASFHFAADMETILAFTVTPTRPAV